ncbi:unnamed protein product, partial [Amoebophrya sp. A25]|eukprot:GSA25T00000869001.1
MEAQGTVWLEDKQTTIQAGEAQGSQIIEASRWTALVLPECDMVEFALMPTVSCFLVSEVHNLEARWIWQSRPTLSQRSCSMCAMGSPICFSHECRRSKALQRNIERGIAPPAVVPTELSQRMQILADDYLKEQALEEAPKVASAGRAFRLVRKMGPKRHGRNQHPQRWKCDRCKISYHTTYGAMQEHSKAHKIEDFIKIGVIKSRARKETLSVGSIRWEYR